MLKIYIENYSKFLPKYKNNLEAAVNLMDTLNLSGCFSDELIKKFWHRVNDSLQIILSGEEYDFKEDIESFKNIYEPYCIFSEEFKCKLRTLFFVILTKPNEKRKIKKNK